MSLTQLQSLRRGGQRPPTVTVIVGTPPKSFEDGPDKVVITGAVPDLSPLVGLPVHLIDLQDDKRKTLQVIAALQDMKTELLGGAGAYGAVGVSADHEHAMQLYRETLCKT